ncbi:MAG: hypothetical protein RR317_04705 [Bilophila sp.]
MPLIEHGELVRHALEYILEERNARPGTSLPCLLDEAGMRFNLTPLDAQSLCRLLAETITPDATCDTVPTTSGKTCQ